MPHTTAMASGPHLRRSSPSVVRTLSPRFLSNNLLSFDEIPKWHQDNEFIRYGYRLISGSAQVSFCSWLYIHNESVNIYSHLIPTIIFLLGEWYIKEYLISKYSNITSADILIFTFYPITVIICLGFSTIYHTLMNHSSKVEQLLLQLDLIGIVILILGDFISGIYMVFWCEPLQRKIYWSMVSLFYMPIFFFNLIMVLTLVGRLELLDYLLSVL